MLVPSGIDMQDALFPFVGGLGLFLIGMMLLSDGLVAFGGDLMKRALARFTGTPFKAFVSGALATVVVQSSTATTVTLIGFVSAGLITFSQAIGVLIGASLGNTATGWVVATLGLKVNLGFYTLPLIGIGALLKLMGRGRAKPLGLAMAGFGLMFMGLSTLQEGMRGLAAGLDLARLPTTGHGARLLIMLMGLALTAILQSSSAAIATTLTALHTQAINMDQAAALVVGAAIGTTLTGALVTIGGTVHAKRTALAYILFNAVAGLLAIALLPVFLAAIEWLGRLGWLNADATSLAAFHTLFIAVGVALFLPWVHRFARLVERLLPDEAGDALTARLDNSMLSIPSVALEASARALEQITLRLLDVYGEMLAGQGADTRHAKLSHAGQALDEIYRFVGRIELPAKDARTGEQRLAQLHALDHLMRFRTRLTDLSQAAVDLTEPGYGWALDHSRQILALARQGIETHDLFTHQEALEQHATALTGVSREVRNDVLQGTTAVPESAANALKLSDTARWLERTGHHIARICHHLAQGHQAAPRASA